MINNKAKSQGFTIIELMIATTVFSTILLLVTSGLIQIGNTYYRGALQARTQETARNIIDEISRGIQFSGAEIKTTTGLTPSDIYPSAGGKYGICINNVGYSYILDRQLATSSGPDQTSKALISYDSCGVKDVTDASVVGREMLGIGMRLTQLDVESLGNSTYTVTVEVASGARDLFNPDDTSLISNQCKGGAGGQFCAISRLSTVVQKRIN